MKVLNRLFFLFFSWKEGDLACGKKTGLKIVTLWENTDTVNTSKADTLKHTPPINTHAQTHNYLPGFVQDSI